MSFKHLNLKCLILLLNALKLHLKLLNFQNQKKNSQKTKIDGGYPPHVKFMPEVNPPPHRMKPWYTYMLFITWESFRCRRDRTLDLP
jgi:hypothetical protein